jgi:hypothetical protein
VGVTCDKWWMMRENWLNHILVFVHAENDRSGSSGLLHGHVHAKPRLQSARATSLYLTKRLNTNHPLISLDSGEANRFDGYV